MDDTSHIKLRICDDISSRWVCLPYIMLVVAVVVVVVVVVDVVDVVVAPSGTTIALSSISAWGCIPTYRHSAQNLWCICLGKPPGSCGMVDWINYMGFDNLMLATTRTIYVAAGFTYYSTSSGRGMQFPFIKDTIAPALCRRPPYIHGISLN